MPTPVESKVFKDGRRPWRAVLSIANARRSLAGKLMVVMLVTTGIALTSAGAALLYTDLRDNRAAWAEDLRTEAAILALGVTPALSFDDHELAQRSLEALQARASISAAALYDADGGIFARYARADQAEPPQRLTKLQSGDCASMARMCWSRNP
jgi:Periplasmic sensor domain